MTKAAGRKERERVRVFVNKGDTVKAVISWYRPSREWAFCQMFFFRHLFRNTTETRDFQSHQQVSATRSSSAPERNARKQKLLVPQLELVIGSHNFPALPSQSADGPAGERGRSLELTNLRCCPTFPFFHNLSFSSFLLTPFHPLPPIYYFAAGLGSRFDRQLLQRSSIYFGVQRRGKFDIAKRRATKRPLAWLAIGCFWYNTNI